MRGYADRFLPWRVYLVTPDSSLSYTLNVASGALIDSVGFNHCICIPPAMAGSVL